MPRAIFPAAIGVLLSVGVPTLRAQSTPKPPRFSGYLQLRETYEQHEGLTASVNRARLYVDGGLATHFFYRLSADFRNGGTSTTRAGVSLVDALVRWSPSTQWSVTAGQFKTPFSREYLLQPPVIETADRAAVAESLPPKRDIGVMGSYATDRAALSAGVFNGEGVNTVVNRDSTVLAVARLTVVPLKSLELGVNSAWYGSDSTRYGADAGLVTPRTTARVEFIGQHRATGGNDDYGWYALAAYRVRPRIQVVARQEDFRRPAPGLPAINATTAGVNLESPDRYVRLTIEYISREVAAVRRGSVLAQLQLRF